MTIAAHRDHAVARDATFQRQHDVVGADRQWSRRWLLLGEVLCHNPVRSGVGARVGNLIEPLAGVAVKVVEARKLRARKKPSRTYRNGRSTFLSGMMTSVP